MKKLITLAVVCVMAVACVGCSSGEETSSTGGGEVEPAKVESASGYTVEIGEATVTEDYEGNAALVVEYTWTNAGDEATMFEVAIDDKAYQNGVQLEYATISVDNKQFDMEASWLEIKPGATQTVYQAFLLADQSDVEIEVTEWLYDDILAEKVVSVA